MPRFNLFRLAQIAFMGAKRMRTLNTFKKVLFISTLILPCVASADTFDDAVNEYLKGFKECTEANTLRAKDLASAKKKFDIYLKTLDQAVAIDSTILSSTQRDMDKNLRYCERVEVDIKRAEATPILEKGFTYCDTAKDAIDAGDVATAQTNLDEYKRYRDDAFIITDSIMEVFALASKVRACSRVEEKLAEASRKESAVAEAMTRASNDYQSFLKECNSVKGAITSPKFSLNNLDSINQQLTNALKFKKAARENGDAFATMSAQPERDDSKQLKQLVDNAAACEGEVSGHIRTATKNKRTLEKDIQDGAAQLQKSLAACESTQKMSERFNDDAEAARAEAEYNNSANLKRKVTGNSQLISAVQTYNSWKASQDFSRLMNQTEACQTKAAASIKTQKAALANKAQRAKEDAARLAKQEEERQRAAEEKARQEAEAAAREAERKAQEAAARKKAQEEAAKAAKLDDVEADPVEDEFGSFGDEGDGSGKSWTDLVR